MSGYKSNLNPAFRSKFSEDIFNLKYRYEGAETWDQLASTLVTDVCGQFLQKDVVQRLYEIIRDMKFIPGGRYVYYAGRPNKFFNKCCLLRSEADAREDWANLSWKAESCLMIGGSISVGYSVFCPSGASMKLTGGSASGPIPKMNMIKEIGRRVMQGVSRRSAIYASLNWQHVTSQIFCRQRIGRTCQSAPPAKPCGTSSRKTSIFPLRWIKQTYRSITMTNDSCNILQMAI